jgi:hypothetical protein
MKKLMKGVLTVSTGFLIVLFLAPIVAKIFDILFDLLFR